MDCYSPSNVRSVLLSLHLGWSKEIRFSIWIGEGGGGVYWCIFRKVRFMVFPPRSAVVFHNFRFDSLRVALDGHRFAFVTALGKYRLLAVGCMLGSSGVDGVASEWSGWRSCGWNGFTSFDEFVGGDWHWHPELNFGLRCEGQVGSRMLRLAYNGSWLVGDRREVFGGVEGRRG